MVRARFAARVHAAQTVVAWAGIFPVLGFAGALLALIRPQLGALLLLGAAAGYFGAFVYLGVEYADVHDATLGAIPIS